jgi:catechol 2,3-dioxygenase-like lactoylglutathione lyase family enzyme
MVALTAYPLITVKHLQGSRDFYLRHFAMVVIFEASWVVMLANGSAGRICLGLMSQDHPSSPRGPEVFDGRGMIMTFQVENVADLYARLKQADAPLVYDLTEEPWGQRRFMTRDPSGILIDVVEHIEPAPGFWDKYLDS